MAPIRAPDPAALKAAHCWFGVDAVPGEPEVTAFKRAARWHQARWREQQRLPIGSHLSGQPRLERPNGSRVRRAEAEATGANFLSAHIRDAVLARLAEPQPHETLDTGRLWCDLLSSMPMCFNLFGELHGQPDRLAAATDAVWPDHPGRAANLHFEWSPGRRSTRYLGDRTAFDAAIVLRLDDEARGIVGIETKYHEHATAEKPPDPQTRLPRYREVSVRSGVFAPGWEGAIVGTEVQQIWRDHLLVLSMLQQPDDGWAWGRYVLVYPGGNPSFADAAARYRDLLVDDATFEVRTIEELLDAHVLHPVDVEARFRERYIVS